MKPRVMFDHLHKNASHVGNKNLVLGICNYDEKPEGKEYKSKFTKTTNTYKALLYGKHFPMCFKFINSLLLVKKFHWVAINF